jgi:hypothetical protein
MRIKTIALIALAGSLLCSSASAQGLPKAATSGDQSTPTSAITSPMPVGGAPAQPAAARPDQKPVADAAAQTQAATSPAAAKPSLTVDPHKVLTNDDLQKLAEQDDGTNLGGGSVDLSEIYNCDIHCYNRVRELAQVYPASNLDWMRQLHTGLDKLKDDADWRAVLVRLGGIRSDYCSVAEEEKDALRAADNFENVTDEQINIREEYNRKLQALNKETTDAYGSMTPLQAKYSRMVAEFMSIQVSRVMQSRCDHLGSADNYPNYHPNE